MAAFVILVAPARKPTPEAVASKTWRRNRAQIGLFRTHPAKAATDTVLVCQLDLDRRIGGAGHHGTFFVRRDRHRYHHQSGSRIDRRQRTIPVALAPTKHLVRVHVVAPRNH